MQKALRRNISLMYALMGLDNAMFWSAIWILYYLRFTNYAGIGIIETVMILSTFIFEIPTGAIADLLGKKKTLIVAFLFEAVGNVLMGFAGSFAMLLVSVFTIVIGASLISGTAQALIYDSLVSLKEEDRYEKILGNSSTIKLIILAISSVLGGFMYNIHPSLPFHTVGIALFVASIVAFFLVEPPVDTEKFSLRVYIHQTKYGFLELFRNSTINVTIIMIILGAIISINHHFLLDAQIVAQGWTEQQLGIITAVMFIVSALMAQLTSFVSQKLGKVRANIMTALMISLTMIAIPWLGMIIGTVIIMTRKGLQEIYENTANAIINQEVRSQYRATALSAYNMLISIPYVVSAFLIGSLIDNNSINTVGVWIGCGIFIVSVYAIFGTRRYRGSGIE